MTFDIYSNTEFAYIDITPYIEINGLEYQLSDIDSPEAGRTLDGIMHRGKVGDKEKWMLKFRTLTTSELNLLIGLVSEETITCRYLSPKYGSVVTATMYVGDRKASHCRSNGNVVKWSGLAFDLIEV